MRCPAMACSAGAAVHLHSAHPQALTGGMDFDLLLFADRARNQRSCDHGSKALHGEHAIDRQAEHGAGIFGWNLGGQPRQFALQLVESRARLGADGDDRRSCRIEERAREELRHFHGHNFESFRIDQVGLGQNSNPALHRKQAADFEVFARLRLYGFVGCDHQQHQIDAAHSGQHVAHKAFMAGDVDQTNADRLPGRTLQVEVGEAEVYGDAAAFLLFEAVGINAGKGANQRALAVVNVARRADNHRLHGRQCTF